MAELSSSARCHWGACRDLARACLNDRRLSPESCSDLAQEITAKVAEFDGRIAHIKAFVRQVAATTVVDYFRRRNAGKRRHSTASVSVHELDIADRRHECPETLAEALEAVGILEKDLPPRQFQALIAKYFLAFTCREIGEMLDCSEEAASSLLLRAMKNSRSILEGME